MEDVKYVKNRNLVAKEIAKLSQEAKQKFNEKKKHSLEVVLSRKKKTVKIFEPDQFDELSPELLAKFVDDNEESIFKELIDDPSEMIMFATLSNLEILRFCTIWAMDSTFKVVLVVVLMLTLIGRANAAHF